jgi:hypothetical protein
LPRLESAEVKDILSGKSGRLTGVDAVEENGAALMRLRFDRILSDDSTKCDSWATLDPSLHGAVIAYAQHRSWGTMKGRVEYQTSISDVAYPKRIQEENTTNDGDVIFRRTILLGVPRPCTLSADKFRLEAFGLVAPNSDPPPSGQSAR